MILCLEVLSILLFYKNFVALLKVEFAGCHIREIREQSLEVTTESFAFLNNIVTDVMSAGFTVSALNISFLGNIFKYLQNRAFEEVTPVKNSKFTCYVTVFVIFS